jgi:transcriptional regulator with XRE-family HTH domain
MSSFDYIKTIRQKGCTLQQVADASGMTKGYLSQLLNAKIKSPSAQKLEALHRFWGWNSRVCKRTSAWCLASLPAAYRAYLSDSARL